MISIKTIIITTLNLKVSQVVYRIYYRVLSILSFYKKITLPHNLEIIPQKLFFTEYIKGKKTWYGGNNFVFLNVKKDFGESIDWNYFENGKLWCYNLNYFDFLIQSDITLSKGSKLIEDYISGIRNKEISIGLEPYPISLRCLNWIKFIVKHNQYNNKIIINYLFAQYSLLAKRMEYHLLGNHLLENAFSLLFAGYYFNSESFYLKSKKLIYRELNEQILEDGCHFELSPMYHQIILSRLLDIINLTQNNHQFEDHDFSEFLINKSKLMLSFLNNINFRNGNIPLFNDSSFQIAPETESILEYAERLNIAPLKTKLSSSGYRKFSSNNYECICDIGIIGPKYLPGHGHCDIFNFELYCNKLPVIVDTGTSTYEKKHRQQERSTIAHNTVYIKDIEQSEIWGFFRVGAQAKIQIIEEKSNFINAIIPNYGGSKIKHQRAFNFQKNYIEILDKVHRTEKNALLNIHFHPDIDLHWIKDDTVLLDFISIKFENHINIKLLNYKYARSFNERMNANMISVQFINQLKTRITIL